MNTRRVSSELLLARVPSCSEILDDTRGCFVRMFAKWSTHMVLNKSRYHVRRDLNINIFDSFEPLHTLHLENHTAEKRFVRYVRFPRWHTKDGSCV